MTPGGDAAVCRALAANLLKLPEGLAGRPAPACCTFPLVQKLLRALQRHLRARSFRLVRGRLGPNGEPAANATV